MSTRAGDTYHIELGTARAFVLGGSKQALVLSGPDANQQVGNLSFTEVRNNTNLIYVYYLRNHSPLLPSNYL